MDGIELSWDLEKAKANLAKHGVAFEAAADVMDDPLAVVRPDHEHSNYENRYVLVGEDRERHLMTVVFTIRGDDARIISARSATRKERIRYMEEKPTTIHDAAPYGDDMLEDYGDLEGWKRNPFRFRRTARLVMLDPDVSEAFPTTEAVNSALRGLIAGRRGAEKPDEEE